MATTLRALDACARLDVTAPGAAAAPANQAMFGDLARAAGDEQ